MNKYWLVGATLALVVLAGCRGVDDDPDFVNEDGSVDLFITDGPLEIANDVIIQLQSVQITPVDGDVIEVDLSDRDPIDLLNLTGEERERLINGASLPAGSYESMRLELADTGHFIRVASGMFPLTIPDEEQDALTIAFNLEVEDDTDADFTIDFDLRRSLRHVGPDTFELHPRLRLVDTDDTATMRGTVAMNLVEDDSDCENGGVTERFGTSQSVDKGNAVYVFSGTGATVQDIRDGAGDPLTTATVDFNGTTGEYEFLIAYLPRGNYTLAFTCEALEDDPEADDSVNMDFSDSVDVNLTADGVNDVRIE